CPLHKFRRCGSATPRSHFCEGSLPPRAKMVSLQIFRPHPKDAGKSENPEWKRHAAAFPFQARAASEKAWNIRSAEIPGQANAVSIFLTIPRIGVIIIEQRREVIKWPAWIPT
ncbi:MAG: hypothetical protein IKE30_05700, partial [Clostridia bacterium]|nr:hypothetical protein [Clostridia bacterium]